MLHLKLAENHRPQSKSYIGPTTIGTHYPKIVEKQRDQQVCNTYGVVVGMMCLHTNMLCRTTHWFS